MTVSVDGADAGSDVGVAPFLLEAPISFNPVTGRYELTLPTAVDLLRRRLTISTDEGGAEVVQRVPGRCSRPRKV